MTSFRVSRYPTTFAHRRHQYPGPSRFYIKLVLPQVGQLGDTDATTSLTGVSRYLTTHLQFGWLAWWRPGMETGGGERMVSREALWLGSWGTVGW